MSTQNCTDHRPGPRRRQKCIVFGRCANIEQAEHILGSQITALRNFATDNRMVVVDEVGVIGSCKNPKINHELDQLLRRKLARGDFSILLVTGFDRIARRFAEWKVIQQQFADVGVLVIDAFSGTGLGNVAALGLMLNQKGGSSRE